VSILAADSNGELPSHLNAADFILTSCLTASANGPNPWQLSVTNALKQIRGCLPKLSENGL